VHLQVAKTLFSSARVAISNITRFQPLNNSLTLNLKSPINSGVGNTGLVLAKKWVVD
jgi:hypothetical protein